MEEWNKQTKKIKDSKENSTNSIENLGRRKWQQKKKSILHKYASIYKCKSIGVSVYIN